MRLTVQAKIMQFSEALHEEFSIWTISNYKESDLSTHFECIKFWASFQKALRDLTGVCCQNLSATISYSEFDRCLNINKNREI